MPNKRGGKGIPITDKQRNNIVALYDDKMTERTIAKVVGVSRGGVRGILARAGRLNFFSTDKTAKIVALFKGGLDGEEIAQQTGIPIRTVYTVMFYAREQEKMMPVRTTVEDIIDERLSIRRQWKPGRYVFIADLHIAFHSKAILEQLLAIKGDYDGCIIAGDLIDEYWISTFRKETVVDHGQEIESAKAIIRLLIKRFHRVLYIPGNHEDRRWKRFLEALTPAAALLGNKGAELYTAANDCRSWYYHGIPNLTMHQNWFVDICNGRIVVGHPDRFQKVPGQAPLGALEHLYGHRKLYQMGDIDAFFMGHTHRMSGPTHRLGTWVMELPCLCPVLPYQVSSKASNAGTIDIGFYICTTRADGSLWYNESRAVLLEDYKIGE